MVVFERGFWISICQGVPAVGDQMFGLRVAGNVVLVDVFEEMDDGDEDEVESVDRPRIRPTPRPTPRAMARTSMVTRRMMRIRRRSILVCLIL